GSTMQDAVALLRNWNGQMEKQTAAPLVVTLVYRQLRKRIADRASPTNGRLYDLQMAPAMVQAILRNPQCWYHDTNDTLISALRDALDEGRQVQGSDTRHWDYGKYNELTIRHPVGTQLPLVGSYFKVGPVAMSGSPTTIKQMNEHLGPSMRFVADFSNWDQSLNNITVGESGQILSSHYKDQWDAYYNGRSFPMQFQHIEAKSTLVVE